MYDAITDVRGIEIGHAQDLDALTGCTVVLCRTGGVAGVDVRGPAPGTRETDLCRPGTLVERVNAVLLAGGSSLGLEAASGVVRFLWEQGIGFDADVARVPIVPGAIIFDLGVGRVAWPDDAMGYEACLNTSAGEVPQGCVGAGTGASVGKLLGPAGAMKSGLGTASLTCPVSEGRAIVAALVVVNAVGDVVLPESETIVAGARDPATGRLVDSMRALLDGARGTPRGYPLPGNTTIGVVATDALLSVEQINHLARVAHDGLARTIRPAHTMVDGDTIFGLATGLVPIGGTRDMVALGAAGVQVVERAVVRAVRTATPAGGLPAAG